MDAETFFAVSETSSGAYVKVISDVQVAGFEFVRTPDGDLLGLNAQSAADQLINLYFPQMAVLGPWKTELAVVNYSSQPAIVTLSAFKPDGTLYHSGDLQNNPIRGKSD
ncbi:hypothetical protein MYX82_00605 [Acidobacteria bacterium AH-259-D05]|nr:hypothetical protein [Acidobacteria bacterium AH-259-D05]